MNPSEIEFFDSNDILFQRIIAQGGSGTVFYVYSIKYNDNFALKKIPQEIFNEAEVECLKQIDDPKIVSLYNIFRFETSVYLLFEYCPNDLEKLIRKSPNLTQNDIKRYCRDVISCVKSCHDRKVAHSDIKPSNFLIDKYDRVKIGDFGLSSIYSNDPFSTAYKGTLYFMAPEIFLKQRFNAMSADIWAVGVTLFFIATKKFPFKSKKTTKLITKIQLAKYKKEMITNPLLYEVIDKCLQIDPLKRCTCKELLSMPYFNEDNSLDASDRIQLSRKDPLMKSHNLIIKPQLSKSAYINLQFLKNSRSVNHSRIQLIGNNSKSTELFNLSQ